MLELSSSSFKDNSFKVSQLRPVKTRSAIAAGTHTNTYTTHAHNFTIGDSNIKGERERESRMAV